MFEQTLDDIEYIFINDCTPDASMEVLAKTLEEYPNRKEQVRIINMEHNSGQGAVRRRGMLEAKGEYQIHCDSDDWVEPEMYESLYNSAIKANADITICDFYIHTNSKKVYEKHPECVSQKEFVNYNDKEIWWTLWCRLYNSSFIKEHNLYPIEGHNFWEDVLVSIKSQCYASSICVVHQPMYHYYLCRNDSSVTGKNYDKMIDGMIKCIDELESFFGRIDFDAGIFLYYRKVGIKSNYLYKTPADFEGFIKCFPEIKRYRSYSSPSSFYRFCWNMLAHGFSIPYKFFIAISKLKK